MPNLLALIVEHNLFILFALKNIYYNYDELRYYDNTHAKLLSYNYTNSAYKLPASVSCVCVCVKCENVEKPVHSYSLCCRCRSSKKNTSTIAELYNNLYASQMVAADQRAKMSPQRTISLVSTQIPLLDLYRPPNSSV